MAGDQQHYKGEEVEACAPHQGAPPGQKHVPRAREINCTHSLFQYSLCQKRHSFSCPTSASVARYPAPDTCGCPRCGRTFRCWKRSTTRRKRCTRTRRWGLTRSEISSTPRWLLSAKNAAARRAGAEEQEEDCLLYTSPSPRDRG
eukprot:2099600-Rhodomonas_salina.1